MQPIADVLILSASGSNVNPVSCPKYQERSIAVSMQWLSDTINISLSVVQHCLSLLWQRGLSKLWFHLKPELKHTCWNTKCNNIRARFGNKGDRGVGCRVLLHVLLLATAWTCQSGRCTCFACYFRSGNSRSIHHISRRCTTRPWNCPWQARNHCLTGGVTR